MAWPTADEIRTFLSGYKVNDSIVPDAWISSRLTNFVIPFIERVTRLKFDSEETYTEYLSGTGHSILILSRKPITSLESISYVSSADIDSSIAISGIEVIKEEGILKNVASISEGSYTTDFRKGKRNIKVTYKAGFSSVPDKIKEAAIYLSSEQVLGYIGARTGGGSISVQGFSRNFGERGRYQDIRNDLKRQAMFSLSEYKTSVVGGVS